MWAHPSCIVQLKQSGTMPERQAMDLSPLCWIWNAAVYKGVFGQTAILYQIVLAPEAEERGGNGILCSSTLECGGSLLYSTGSPRAVIQGGVVRQPPGDPPTNVSLDVAVSAWGSCEKLLNAPECSGFFSVTPEITTENVNREGCKRKALDCRETMFLNLKM